MPPSSPLPDTAVDRLASTLALRPGVLRRVETLLSEGNTIPFLARYRQEATGGLDEVALRAIETALEKARNLESRREEIRAALEGQGVLTADLGRAIAAADKLMTLEDLYLPYRPKRRTRAGMAKEKGLAPLADDLRQPPRMTPEESAGRFVDPAKGVASVDEALAGARDILAEWLAEEPSVRGRARTLAMNEGVLKAAKAPKGEDPQGKYTQYHQYAEPVKKAQPHRILACDRGEAEGALKVAIALPDARILAIMQDALGPAAPAWRAQRDLAIEDALKRLLGPAIERDVRASLTERAQAHAIGVFAANLRALLLQPPLRDRVVLGIDPGFRTGCKVVVVDPTGRPLIDGFAIYPHEPQKQWKEANATLRELIARHGVSVIAIGNGTASRETEALVAEAIRGTQAAYVIVSEAGASVYSASETARDEFPALEATQRGTISIARRLQDPLAELVKIDPQAIGVGQYQHDLEAKALAQALDGVVEDVVNHVGVDLNTASSALLSRVAGLNKKIASAIVATRGERGRFRRRGELKEVKGLGDRTFEQCAGFLRIPDGQEPLDNTAIHPESYPAARQLLTTLGVPIGPGLAPAIAAARRSRSREELARTLGIGIPTLGLILDNLEKPGRDPREDLPRPHLRQDVLKLEDLTPGMRVTGTVRNVVDFGAFVDIGVKNDGLVHVSELADRFVRNALEVVSVGDVLEVEVLEVDLKRGRVSLSRKRAMTPQASR